jgi:Protein of unknown function (DUF551).
MYESPITAMISDITTEMQQEQDREIMNAILSVGISVDKDELVKALSYDRQQYGKGYAEGYAAAQADTPHWISVEERLPGDCEHVLCRIEEECMYYDATGGEVFAMDSYLCEAHYRRGKHKGWYKAVSPDISSCTNNVTHWMPLPAPPKEVLPNGDV